MVTAMASFILNAKIDGKDSEIEIQHDALKELYEKMLECYREDEDKREESIINDAIKVAARHGRVSTALLQRELHIGYGRAAQIIEELEKRGVIKDREITPQYGVLAE